MRLFLLSLEGKGKQYLIVGLLQINVGYVFGTHISCVGYTTTDVFGLEHSATFFFFIYKASDTTNCMVYAF